MLSVISKELSRISALKALFKKLKFILVPEYSIYHIGTINVFMTLPSKNLPLVPKTLNYYLQIVFCGMCLGSTPLTLSFIHLQRSAFPFTWLPLLIGMLMGLLAMKQTTCIWLLPDPKTYGVGFFLSW